MSIGSLGASAISALLSQLTSTQATTSATSAPADEFGGCSTASPPQQGGSGNALTGSTKASLSDEILALLTQLQQQAGAISPTTGSSTSLSTISASTTIGTTGTASDPLSKLFAAMDGDGDGTVSQSEMETYIQSKGGTAAQADALFSGLNQNGSGNLTQTQLASDLQQASPAGGAHHAHHHHHARASADQIGNDLVKAMDGDGNGAVDQSEFETFVTGLGGTAGQADADFSALDPNGTGSVTANQFSSAVTALQSANASGPSPILTLLDAFKQTAGPIASSVSLTA